MGGLHILHLLHPPTARGVSGDLVNSPLTLLPSLPPCSSSPSPGVKLLHSPSTSSHPSLLRFHFNRWSSSSSHTALWENLRRTRQQRVKTRSVDCWNCFHTIKLCCQCERIWVYTDVKGWALDQNQALLAFLHIFMHLFKHKLFFMEPNIENILILVLSI